MPFRLVTRAAATFGALLACAPLAAQGVPDQTACYGRIAGLDSAEPIAGGDAGAVARIVAAERSVAAADLAQGRAHAAMARLERLGPAADAVALATLALAYDAGGCRAAFVAAADRALASGIGGEQAADLRRRLAAVRGMAMDSVSAAGLAPARAAEPAPIPSPQARLSARLQAGRDSLEAAASGVAATLFRSVSDTARGVMASLDARLAGADITAFVRAATARRALGYLWAADAAAGRLVRRNGAGVAAVTPAQVDSALAAFGPVAADAAIRALVWTPGGPELGAVRAALDALAEADARSARAVERAARLRAGRAARIADAARYVATVRAFGDSIAAADASSRALADSVARADSVIAAGIARYRGTILAKIADARALAAENRARLDSVAPLARRAGDVTTTFLEAEQGTVAAYLAVAEATAGALERALTRLDVVFQRDSIHAKRDRLRAGIAAARIAHDSTLVAALAGERALAEAVDREIAAADAERAAAQRVQDEAVERAVAAGAAALVARAPAARATLDDLAYAALAGQATALFFLAVDGDTLRAPAADVTRRRDAAIAALAQALDARAESPLRPQLLLQSGEVLTRKADADFAASQRAGVAQERPDYGGAIARFDEIVRLHATDPRADVAAYTMGTLAYAAQRYDDAARAFELVKSRPGSRYRAEAYFRDGDGRFEQAVKLAGTARRQMFAQAAASYAEAIPLSPAGGDIYFLALYKLGWSEYMQAEAQSSDEYRRAVEDFARLVREVDALPRERQARLALRQEAIDYLAIAITQLGGPEEAVRYLGAIPDVGTRMLVLRRVAHALRDQGEFNSAIIAFRGALAQAPEHPAGLETRTDLVDLFQNRMLEPARAQEARLELADALAPTSPWGAANAARAAEAADVRERTLREAGGYAMSQRQHANAAELFSRYLREFSDRDSAQRVSALEGDARFGARDWMGSGIAHSRTATRWQGDSALAAAARRNAVVAFDSALVTSRRSGAAAADLRAIEDSLIVATDRFAAQAPSADARAALVAMGRRMSESQRWDVVAATFTRVAEQWPADAGTPDARKFVGDARYREGRYDDAQVQWRLAHDGATAAGRRAFADTIVSVRVAAAVQASDSLARGGRHVAAADTILAGLAATITDPTRAADLLRNAIEVHLAADSTMRLRGDSAAAKASRARAIASIETLAERFPAYQHTFTYRALRAKLLSDVGRAADAAAALGELVAANPRWPARADAMVRIAVLYDSLGRPADAAAAYEAFSTAYPQDRRAADAQYNAAVTLREAGDQTGAARSWGAFATRFPRDPRAGEASAARVAALRAAGDTANIGAELARLCVRPPPAMAATCADRAGATAFREGMARWDAYAALKLEIRTRAQLTRAGVEQASLPKQQALRAMTQAFSRAIASGTPRWVAAGSFQTGLAQWHYGLFLRDVVLPADVTDAQRTGAEQGSAAQAQQYFDAAIKAWTALVDKAAADQFDNEWVERARAALRGEGIPPREKGATP